MTPAAPDTPQARHIGIDASRLVRDRRGMGRWVRNVLRWMPEERPDIRYTLYLAQAADEPATHALLTSLDAALPARVRYAPLRALPDSEADVVWYPWNGLQTPARRAAMVASVADVAPMLQLDHRWWKVLKRARFRRRFRRTVQLAHRVLTISRFSADELVRHAGADADRIHITWLGTDDMARAAEDVRPTLERLGITSPFFLSVGALDARKNLRTLYQAMHLLHRRGDRVPLVRCGPRASGTRLPFVHDAGFVSDADLATLYRAATALVFPSRYEGFGLPVAEAMAVGGCVVCADASSLPEVAGDAGLYFPWQDAEALASQLGRLLHHPGLREQYAQAAQRRAQQFRWRTTAAGTLAAFDAAVADVRR